MAQTVEEMDTKRKAFERAKKEGRVVRYSGYEVIIENDIENNIMSEPSTPNARILRNV